MVIKPKNPGKLKEILSSKSLFLFGMGGMSKRITDYCLENDIKIDGYVDSNKEKQRNAEAISPETLKELHSNANIVIATVMYFNEVEKALLELGFKEEQIIPYKVFLADEITWLDLDEGANWTGMRIRTKQLSKWIDEKTKSIVDYAAGEMFIKTMISPEVEYYPIDYIKRTDETILCDLNKDSFPNINADVAIVGGILELLTTTEKLVKHICETTKLRIVTSYITLEKFSDISGRRDSAYITDYTEKQFVELFEQNGFILREKEISDYHNVETLFMFERTE